MTKNRCLEAITKLFDSHPERTERSVKKNYFIRFLDSAFGSARNDGFTRYEIHID